MRRGGTQHTERSVEVEQARGLTQRGTGQKTQYASSVSQAWIRWWTLLAAWPHKEQWPWTCVRVGSQPHFASSLQLTLAVRRTRSFSSPPHLWNRAAPTAAYSPPMPYPAQEEGSQYPGGPEGPCEPGGPVWPAGPRGPGEPGGPGLPVRLSPGGPAWNGEINAWLASHNSSGSRLPWQRRRPCARRRRHREHCGYVQEAAWARGLQLPAPAPPGTPRERLQPLPCSWEAAALAGALSSVPEAASSQKFILVSTEHVSPSARRLGRRLHGGGQPWMPAWLSCPPTSAVPW